ncbi:hypothetical protein O0L34_g15049 [Tuta absoluta]|nr:hypothetical protein O0L34_g15049 [Tuta absoluta]
MRDAYNMREHLIVLLLIFDSQYVGTDISAPKLEIDQREYSNPDTLKDVSINTAVEDKSTVESKRNVENMIASLENSLVHTVNNEQIEIARLTNRKSKARHPKEISKEDSIPFNFKVLDIADDLNSHEDALKDPGVITVASYNIPKIPKKVYGPQKRPFKRLPFSGVGPAGIDDADKPSCNSFSRTARFNPYSVLDDRWFSFYRWSLDQTPLVIEFNVPTSLEKDYARKNLDKILVRPINWSSRMVLMQDLIYNTTALLVERGNHGQFWMYPFLNNYTKAEIEPIDVRFKQTADNKYFAFVLCADDRAFIFSRVRDVPPKNEILDVVAKVGWRGRDGRSYLYQGHKWGPIPEITEEEYWRPSHLQKDEEVLPPPPPEDDPEEEPIKYLNKDYTYKPKNR